MRIALEAIFPVTASGRRKLRFRNRLLELERIVDDDDIGTSPGQHPPTAVMMRQPCGVVSNSGTG
jgi:hypothetical protein